MFYYKFIFIFIRGKTHITYNLSSWPFLSVQFNSV